LTTTTAWRHAVVFLFLDFFYFWTLGSILVFWGSKLRFYGSKPQIFVKKFSFWCMRWVFVFGSCLGSCFGTCFGSLVLWFFGLGLGAWWR
jgi:hypothetical protein